MMNVLIAACVAAGFPFGMCAVEASHVVNTDDVIEDFAAMWAAPEPVPQNTVGALDLTADEVAMVAALVRAEAGGMQREAKYLVACNFLTDLVRAEGDWEALTTRWRPLPMILDGNWPGTPQGEDWSVANGAVDGPTCEAVPRCRFLGCIADMHTWMANDWIEPGRYELWVGPGGGMMVCVRE